MRRALDSTEPTAVNVKPTADQLRDARDWLADCTWPDLTPAAAMRLPAARVVTGIEAHYSGGWAQFIADAS